MKKTLTEQIVLTKFYSVPEFKEQLKDGKLRTKSQIELLYLRDSYKFEYYVKRFSLDSEVERRLFQIGRKDLFEIYFSLRRCHDSTEILLVHYPLALSVYAKYHTLRERSQMEMVKQKKCKTTMKYIKKRELCKKARSFFRQNAQKHMVEYYNDKYGLA